MGRLEDFYIQMGPDISSVDPILPQKLSKSVTKRTLRFRIYIFAISILSITGITVVLISTLHRPLFSYSALSSLYTTSLRTISSNQLQRMQLLYTSQCGNSPSQARKRGCHFDMIDFSWQQANCWDEDLYTGFLTRYKDIWYWETPEGNPVPLDEVQAGLYPALHTNWNFYVVHCLYILERMMQGSSSLQLLDDWSPRYSHAKQCTLDLKDTEKFLGNTMMTTVKMWYASCEAR
ncbi:hypothetical protein ACO22_02867 [Paracoccidioides brasiliensis]|uniref:Uncharacterized protein n=1 Tax=Paracoccidioides brasiliensis TaxID=121759 RepID=A0A1D2JHG0_PARBR|nr:hypothetical protein ACO22_02867 [Paracoccidioides brasiliensis]